MARGSAGAAAATLQQGRVSSPSSPQRWDVYEEHVDEAGFLWTQWMLANRAADRTIAAVEAGPEERLRAHLDALVIGGAPVRERFLLPALGSGDPEQVFVATAALLGARDGD